MRSFCTSAPAVSTNAPSGTMPIGQSSRRSYRRCQSGVSPRSAQVSPSTVLTKVLLASSEPYAASHWCAISGHDNHPIGEYSADRW